MNVPARLLGFAVILAASFGAGVGIGTAVGPLDSGAEPVHGVRHAGAAYDASLLFAGSTPTPARD